MSVGSHDGSGGKRILVTLSDISHVTEARHDGSVHRGSKVEHALTLEQARQLRDDLTRELERTADDRQPHLRDELDRLLGTATISLEEYKARLAELA